VTNTATVDAAECCEFCGASACELFGYRRPDGWHWFCANHRIGKHRADARSPAPDDVGGGR
jgi:hypothetical protein